MLRGLLRPWAWRDHGQLVWGEGVWVRAAATPHSSSRSQACALLDELPILNEFQAAHEGEQSIKKKWSNGTKVIFESQRRSCIMIVNKYEKKTFLKKGGGQRSTLRIRLGAASKSLK